MARAAANILVHHHWLGFEGRPAAHLPMEETMDIYKGLTGELPSLFDYRDCRWLALNGIDYREWDLLVRLGKVVE